MPAGDLLRQLDRRLLPPLARGMDRLGRGRLRPGVLSVAALISAAAVLVTAVWAADRRPTADMTVGEVTRVGVVQGDSIPGYVASSRRELVALVNAPATEPARQTYALVTLAAYLAPDRLTPILSDVSVSEVFARLPRPETQTQIVRIPAFRIPDDVAVGMAQVAERKGREARDYQERSAAVTGDEERDRELRAYYDSGALVAQDEATAYRSRCSCVYAAVVRATPAALELIADRPEVRAVDPAPEVTRLDRAVFSPPLPEQVDVVRPPADSGTAPVPSGPVDDPPQSTGGLPPASSDPPEQSGPPGQSEAPPASSGPPGQSASPSASPDDPPEVDVSRPPTEVTTAPGSADPGTPSAVPGTQVASPESPDSIRH